LEPHQCHIGATAWVVLSLVTILKGPVRNHF
jgi:hypothetical protein